MEQSLRLRRRCSAYAGRWYERLRTSFPSPRTLLRKCGSAAHIFDDPLSGVSRFILPQKDERWTH